MEACAKSSAEAPHANPPLTVCVRLSDGAKLVLSARSAPRHSPIVRSLTAKPERRRCLAAKPVGRAEHVSVGPVRPGWRQGDLKMGIRARIPRAITLVSTTVVHPDWSYPRLFRPGQHLPPWQNDGQTRRRRMRSGGLPSAELDTVSAAMREYCETAGLELLTPLLSWDGNGSRHAARPGGAP